ncbi:hypothetical protein J4G53_22475 [Serratia ureilytica]|uniref:hypothetical protein n=1 Tax=Serratia ureilytica TaxID=300181 RepID=UPI001AA0DB48|nr:hypothetical protein [Serratia ureilytica]MBO1811020.1 hypothetical protein [Serratia ureilytica]
MSQVKCELDERTLRDIPVLIYLLRKPTGNPEKEAKNAAHADEMSTAFANGNVCGFVGDEAPQVIEARRALGQIN